MSIIISRHRKEPQPKPTPENETYKKIMHELMYNTHTPDTELSNEQLKSILNTKLQKGEISKETYNYIVNNILISENANFNNRDGM